MAAPWMQQTHGVKNQRHHKAYFTVSFNYFKLHWLAMSRIKRKHPERQNLSNSHRILNLDLTNKTQLGPALSKHLTLLITVVKDNSSIQLYLVFIPLQIEIIMNMELEQVEWSLPDVSQKSVNDKHQSAGLPTCVYTRFSCLFCMKTQTFSSV